MKNKEQAIIPPSSYLRTSRRLVPSVIAKSKGGLVVHGAVRVVTNHQSSVVSRQSSVGVGGVWRVVCGLCGGVRGVLAQTPQKELTTRLDLPVRTNNQPKHYRGWWGRRKRRMRMYVCIIKIIAAMTRPLLPLLLLALKHYCAVS